MYQKQLILHICNAILFFFEYSTAVFNKYNIHMISHTETTGPNQYGFYAVPKALQPKKKYRQQYEDDQQEQDIQTDNPFATLDDLQPVNQASLERDYYVDQAPYPEFKPKQRGLDYGVQIQRGDLFDFDMEVRPLIQILVGRSVVTAINELQEEKEKDERRANLDKYQKKRNAELMVTQRLEAKHKRKIEEADRRRLQKEVYVKSRKEAGKKIIARRNAKESLLGLRADIFNELEEEGYLRSDATYDLKIGYEEWLYQKIMESLQVDNRTSKAAQKIVEESQRDLAKEHQKHIEQERARRQTILDERERIRKENEQRRQKKRIKKQRQKTSLERQGDCVKFDELMEHHEEIQKILKQADLSSGFSREYAGRPTVYASGGLDNFILALLQSSGRQFTTQQIQALLFKVLGDYPGSLQFSLLNSHNDKLNELHKRMQQAPADFMREKNNEIKEIIQQISLDLSLLEATNINIRSSLHRNFLQALLRIHLTIAPQSTEENPFQLGQDDKKRLQYVQRVGFVGQNEGLVRRIAGVDSVLRVRFQVVDEIEGEEVKQQQEKEKTQDEWIDVYDGQYWPRRLKQAKKELNKAEQKAASVTLTSFQNSWVYDQRTLHYLQHELQNLLEVEGGEKLKLYSESLGNISARLGKDLPVYDSELHYGD